MGKKIIWIEDDVDVIYPVILPLEEEGYQIVSITTAGEALDRVEELRQADLILLDLLFPSGSAGPDDLGSYPGLSFLRKLRFEHQIEVPVIVFSVMARQPNVKEKLEDIARVHIVEKPVRPSVLKEEVERILEAEAKVED